MGLETGDFLDDLVQANPVTATDSVTQGADHIRLLKKVLQQTFGLMDGLLQFPTNSVWFKQSNVAADGFVNMIRIGASDEVELTGPVQVLLGGMVLPTGDGNGLSFNRAGTPIQALWKDGAGTDKLFLDNANPADFEIRFDTFGTPVIGLSINGQTRNVTIPNGALAVAKASTFGTTGTDTANTFTANDGTNEGGQITFEGAGSNANHDIDVFSTNMRHLSNNSSDTVLELVNLGAGNYGLTMSGNLSVSGNIIGNVTGNVSGSALTVTQAAQTAITSIGTLTGLTVTAPIAGSVNGSAATVTAAAQPAITSVGSSLSTSGAITADGDITAFA